MITLTLSAIANGIKGKLIGKDLNVSQVLTDTRTTRNHNSSKGNLFVALRGPHFDAHKFLDNLNSSVSAVVVDHQCEIDIPQIVVADTRKALADIARLNRASSQAVYVAITGSSGKTTVKEMVASILSRVGKTFATKGNLNNDIGVPLTLLSIVQDTEFAVIELGANHEGEIAYTADITKPQVALVNNISEAHLQGFGDIQGVARAKSEIYFSLAENGVAVLNKDDTFYSYFENRVSNKKLTFSIKETCDVYASEIELASDQSSRFFLNYLGKKQLVELPLVGVHNVSNALGAAACAIALGISIEQVALGLKNTPVVPGRLIVNKLDNGSTVIDDSYNANVSSMLAAIDLLNQYTESRKVLVLGDMAELGEQGRECHERVGEYAREVGIEQLYSCGVLTQFTQRAFRHENSFVQTNNDSEESDKGFHFSEQSKLIKKLKTEAKQGVTILIKGSRSAHMENVVKALVDDSTSPIHSVEQSCNELSSVASLQGEQ